MVFAYLEDEEYESSETEREDASEDSDDSDDENEMDLNYCGDQIIEWDNELETEIDFPDETTHKNDLPCEHLQDNELDENNPEKEKVIVKQFLRPISID